MKAFAIFALSLTKTQGASIALRGQATTVSTDPLHPTPLFFGESVTDLSAVAGQSYYFVYSADGMSALPNDQVTCTTSGPNGDASLEVKLVQNGNFHCIGNDIGTSNQECSLHADTGTIDYVYVQVTASTEDFSDLTLLCELGSPSTSTVSPTTVDQPDVISRSLSLLSFLRCGSGPAPQPTPQPAPSPISAPSPIANPAPTPNVAPSPIANPAPTPNTAPSPNVNPAPTPNTAPSPIANPAPVLQPVPLPPVPVPSPNANPAPTSPVFIIDLDFPDGTSADDKAVIQENADRWAEIFTAGLPDHTGALAGTTSCGNLPSSVDDLYICAEFKPSGTPGLLGMGGFLWARSGGLPIVGQFFADKDQIEEFKASLNGVIIHEMGHIFGIGTAFWQRQGLVTVSSNACTYKEDSIASETYRELSGCTSGSIPIESFYNATTDTLVCGHWLEQCFGGELMTTVAGDGNIFSNITLSGMEDLGYEVSRESAESYGTSKLDNSCRCDVKREAEKNSSQSTSFNGLSSEGMDIALNYGYAYLEEMKAKRETLGTFPEGVYFAGDQGVAVFYYENGRVYDIVVTPK